MITTIERKDSFLEIKHDNNDIKISAFISNKCDFITWAEEVPLDFDRYSNKKITIRNIGSMIVVQDKESRMLITIDRWNKPTY